MNRIRLVVLSAAMAAFLAFAGIASAAADPTVTSASSSVTTFFTDNLPTLITAFIAIAMVVWVLGLLFRSVGVRKPSKIG